MYFKLDSQTQEDDIGDALVEATPLLLSEGLDVSLDDTVVTGKAYQHTIMLTVLLYYKVL